MKGTGTSKWEVKDGLLTSSGQQSMLFSPRGDYKNFRYRAELKINDRGNSGMYVRTPKEATFNKGYEIQVNSTHTDPVKTGSVYSHVNVYKQLAPPDTFFTQEIEVVTKGYRGKTINAIKITVNGEVLYEFLDYDTSIAEGHFAFQQHDPGSSVQIRKIEVMELPEAPRPRPRRRRRPRRPRPTERRGGWGAGCPGLSSTRAPRGLAGARVEDNPGHPAMAARPRGI